jgi:hypothetical protein
MTCCFQQLQWKAVHLPAGVSDIDLHKVWKEMPLRLVAYMIKVDKKASDTDNDDEPADAKGFDPKIPHSTENKVSHHFALSKPSVTDQRTQMDVGK